MTIINSNGNFDEKMNICHPLLGNRLTKLLKPKHDVPQHRLS